MQAQAYKLTRRHLLGWAAAGPLSACGGGGGGSEAPITLQPTWDATTVDQEYFRFVYLLPGGNATPTPGTHYLFAQGFKAPASIATGPQTLVARKVELATSLPSGSPGTGPVTVDRFLKAGVIHRVGQLNKIVVRPNVDVLIADNYADDGTTLLYAVSYTEWTAPIPLSGRMSANSELQQQEFFLRQSSDTAHYDLNRDWLPGASYFRRRSSAGSDRVNVFDSNGTTYGDTPSPVNTATTTLEAFFASPALANAGGWTNDSVKYTLADGSITTLEGARAWVARNPRPRSASPTPQYLCFIELGGQIYRGGFIRNGTPTAFSNGLDATTPRTHEFRYNLQAVASVRAALKF